MSVLIRGMEMPINCWGCRFCDDCGETAFCNVTGEFYEINDPKQRLGECPLVEVQEDDMR